MKKYSVLFLVILCLASCTKTTNRVEIIGEIKGLGTDTIYMYGMDETYDRIDTIYVENDKFKYSPAKVDTISAAYLLFNNRIEYPIFLDKGNTIEIKGDTSNLDRLTISGNQYNEELTTFQDSLKQSGAASENVCQQKAEEFIKQHRSSFVSVYLLDKYFVKKIQPNFTKINELIGMMTGILLDTPYIRQLSELITQNDNVAIDRYAPHFSLPNAKEEKISRLSEAFKEKYLLVNFWASWSDSISGKRSNRELRDIYRTYKKSKYLSMLGVSLDIDKKQWKDAIKKDTLSWEQVYSLDGLNSDVAKQYSIQQLPANVLIAPDGRIIAKDLQGKELKKKIEEAVAQAAEKDKTNNKKRSNK